MKLMNALKQRMNSYFETILRFPFTVILLMAAAVINAISINSKEDELLTRLIIAVLLGAAVYTVGQLIYERFFKKALMRILMMAIAIGSSIVYYLIVNHPLGDIETGLRTLVIFFILLNAFIWVPVIRSRYNYNQSFMVVFKGFFLSVFFTGILFLGVVLILGATDKLITTVSGHAYEHAANLVFVLLAPIYFLSLIPVYPNDKELQDSDQEQLKYKLAPAKLLEALISYIIIPITVVFTVILILYIVLNIRGEFWTGNLMEPLLISYSITVIIVYLLASNMNTVIVRYFHLVFPKVLVLVVMLQTISSVVRIRELGITYGRYYVILFGIFAVITGIVFSVMPVHKNGIIAPILIAFSVISIVPPVDAFTAGRISQTSRLENALKRNHMLENDIITPNSQVPEKDQKIIRSSVSYLDTLAYTKKIQWLSPYYTSSNFDKTFGFTQYGIGKDNNMSIFITRDESMPVPISGYDFMIYRSIGNMGLVFNDSTFDKNGIKYQIRMKNSFLVLEYNGQEILRFDTDEIFHKFNKSMNNLKTEDVTFTTENSKAALAIVAQNISINDWENGKNQYSDVYILIKIK